MLLQFKLCHRVIAKRYVQIDSSCALG